MNKRLVLLILVLGAVVAASLYSTPPANAAHGIHASECSVLDQAGATYVLTGNINTNAGGSTGGVCVVINGNGITLEGAGNIITGPGNSGVGVKINNKTGVTLQNLAIQDFNIGMELSAADDNIVTGNAINGNGAEGLLVSVSTGNQFSNNTFDLNGFGILIDLSSSNVFTSNIITNSQTTLGFGSIDVFDASDNEWINTTCTISFPDAAICASPEPLPAPSGADLQVTQAHSPQPGTVGLNIAIDPIMVTNNGPDTATGITLIAPYRPE